MGRWLVEKVTSCHTTICLIPHECLSCLEYFSLNSHLHKILAPLLFCWPSAYPSRISQPPWCPASPNCLGKTEVVIPQGLPLCLVSLHRLPSCGLLSTPDGETQLAVTSVFVSPEPCTVFSIYGCPINILKNILFYLFILAMSGLSCST